MTEILSKALDLTTTLDFEAQEKTCGQMVDLDFVSEAEDLCVRILKLKRGFGDPYFSELLNQIISSKYPDDPLVAKEELYQLCPFVREYRSELATAARNCKDDRAAIRSWTTLLINTPSSQDYLNGLTTILAKGKEDHIIIGVWKSLVETYPQHERFRSLLEDAIHVQDDDEMAEKIWLELAANSDDALSRKSLDRIRLRRGRRRPELSLKARFGDNWDHICTICMENQLEVVMVPCGHVPCGSCLTRLLDGKGVCHMCRSTICSHVRPHARLISIEV